MDREQLGRQDLCAEKEPEGKQQAQQKSYKAPKTEEERRNGTTKQGKLLQRAFDGKSGQRGIGGDK